MKIIKRKNKYIKIPGLAGNSQNDYNTQNTQTIPEFTGEIKSKNNKFIEKTEKIIIVHLKINFNENILVKNFDIAIDHLNTERQSQIQKLISTYNSLFAKDKFDIGTVQGYEAHIDLLIDKYCSKRPYRCSIEDMKEIEQQIAKLLENNIIEESYSPFCRPCNTSI